MKTKSNVIQMNDYRTKKETETLYFEEQCPHGHGQLQLLRINSIYVMGCEVCSFVCGNKGSCDNQGTWKKSELPRAKISPS